jgi:hypothetical protein
MSEVKSIEKKQREFMANGHKYIVMDKISIARFKEYEKLVPRLSFGLSFKEIFDKLNKLYTALNKQQFANAAVLCHNMMNGINAVDDNKRVNPALMMAALVINRVDEDPTTYNEELMFDKIADWQTEGYNMMDFFELSLNSIQGFRETLLKYTQAQAETMLEKK